QIGFAIAVEVADEHSGDRRVENGPVSNRWLKRAIAVAQQDVHLNRSRDGSKVVSSYGKIGATVAIEIAGGHGAGRAVNRVNTGLLKRPIPLAQRNPDGR